MLRAVCYVLLCCVLRAVRGGVCYLARAVWQVANYLARAVLQVTLRNMWCNEIDCTLPTGRWVSTGIRFLSVWGLLDLRFYI